jgi:phage protein D
MNLEEKVMPWPNMPDSAIAAAIFGQYGIVPIVQTTSPQLVEPEGTTTQRGSDIRFLRRLARRNGFECYVQPEPISGIDQAYFQPPPSPVGPPQAVINVNMGPETNVDGFNVQYEMTRPTTAVATGLDASTKAPQPALAQASLRVPSGLEPTLTRILPPPITRPADTGLMTSGELQPAVQAIVDESSWALEASGTVGPDAGVLRPGKTINVRGAGRLLSGSYYATRIAHHIDKEGEYTQSFLARRDAVGMTGAELYFAAP